MALLIVTVEIDRRLRELEMRMTLLEFKEVLHLVSPALNLTWRP